MSTKKITRLIHASRPRRGRAKVKLRESQVRSNEICLKLNFILYLNGPLSKADSSDECYRVFFFIHSFHSFSAADLHVQPA